MFKQHSNFEECKESYLKMLEEAWEEGGAWMAAIWQVEGDKVVIRRTTCEFPDSQLRDSIRLLKDNIADSLDPQIERDPLPMAQGLRLRRQEDNGESDQGDSEVVDGPQDP